MVRLWNSLQQSSLEINNPVKPRESCFLIDNKNTGSFNNNTKTMLEGTNIPRFKSNSSDYGLPWTLYLMPASNNVPGMFSDLSAFGPS